ncbi:MAG: hypothetical protein GX323_02670 [Clostridiales bacterium]|nr:hypothetical protein [Clostridiales bacterium]
MSIFGKISTFFKEKVFPTKKRKQIDNFDIYEDIQDYIEQVCDDVIEEQRKQEESKAEYEIVTSYLTDIQKIDRMLPSDRQRVSDLADDIYQLTKERADYQERSRKISNAQYKIFAENEEQMQEIIQKMKGEEEYYSVVKSNLDRLEGEKGSLLYEKETIDNRQMYVNWLAKVTFIWVIVIIGLLKFMEQIRDIDIKAPILIVISIATLFVSYMIFSIFRNKRRLANLLPKIKRTIRLLNRAKIKYVNTKNALDYSCRKYRVHNSIELEYNWNQYLEELEEERKYRQNTGMLAEYANELVSILEKHNVEDPEIWVHQAIALINDKEMVEIRHSLNTRRQNIRQEIEARDELIKSNLDELKELIDKLSEGKLEAKEYLKSIGMDI